MLNNAITLSILHRLGFAEVLIILLIVLVLFGPSYLPKLAKKVGQSVREWKEVGEEKPANSAEIEEVEPIEVVRVKTIETGDGDPVGGSQGEVIEVIDIK